jgi:hypothetical protein
MRLLSTTSVSSFRNAVFPKNGYSHSIATLTTSVNDACRRIQEIFGSDIHYGGVSGAMEVLSSINLINSEICAFMNCEDLHISIADVNIFRLVAFLWELSATLPSFIQGCEHFGFTIAEDDSSFSELRFEVNQFYSSDFNCLDTCLIFFQCLLSLLCPQLGIPRVNKFDRCPIDVLINGIDELDKVLNWLTLLSNLSQYHELWSYVGEMEWFSDEGLKRFYEEYSNVTNILLGGSGSYEMSLLDSMEPIVRLFSAIGKFKESHTICALFENFENCVDIFATVNGTRITNHIHQVHDRLSEIKDWFSNGVNEIGAAHLQFAAAQRSGTYFMSQDNGNYVLLLRFTVENNDESLISGNLLEQFILQLSLIQNENEATASAMHIFIDQFQILTIAYRKFLIMEKFGFISISTSDFECYAGGKHVEDAKYLLNVSEEQMEGFNAWLLRTRMNYKVSLLYWTEELRQLYESVCSPDADGIVLMDFTFRLRPLWSNMLDIEGVRRFHQICLMASVDRHVSNQRFSWLEEVSHLIEDIHFGLIANEVGHCSMQRSEIVLHSACCNDDDIQLVTLRILQQVYKVSFPKMRFYISCFKLTFVSKLFQDRLPHSFEIIDGSVLHTQEQLCLFLDLVKGFPSLRFTIISAERLSSYNLEMLVAFLSN